MCERLLVCSSCSRRDNTSLKYQENLVLSCFLVRKKHKVVVVSRNGDLKADNFPDVYAAVRVSDFRMFSCGTNRKPTCAAYIQIYECGWDLERNAQNWTVNGFRKGIVTLRIFKWRVYHHSKLFLKNWEKRFIKHQMYDKISPIIIHNSYHRVIFSLCRVSTQRK